MKTTIVTHKSRVSFWDYVAEIWNYRELTGFLAYRDFKIKYAQTNLGWYWAILQPILSAFILYLIFNKLANVATPSLPGFVFAFSGIIAWSYVSNTCSAALQATIGMHDLVKQIYFPRAVIPLSKCIEAITELIISVLIFILLLILYKLNISVYILLLPVFLALTIILAFGITIWTSIVTLRFRDLRFVIPFFLRLGIFITPIAYPVSLIPDKYLVLYFMNPVSGMVEGIRLSLSGDLQYINYILISIGMIVLIFFSSIKMMSKIDKKIADYV